MTTNNPFSPAEKAKSRLRMALQGVAGSGKTYTALKIASNMVKPGRREEGLARIAFIDTERGSARLYASENGIQPFDVMELQPNSDGFFAPQKFLDAIKAAVDFGYDFLIIDSLSHAWEGVLEEKAKLDKRPNSNSFTNWRDLTPLHNKLINDILSFPGHVIACMRVKSDYVIEEYEDSGRKKTKVRKIGLKSIMREGVEFEFGVVMDMTDDNTGIVSKTRYSLLAGAVIQKPGVELANALNEWLETGIHVEPPRPKFIDNPGMLQKMYDYAAQQGLNAEALAEALDIEQASELASFACDEAGREDIKRRIAEWKVAQAS